MSRFWNNCLIWFIIFIYSTEKYNLKLRYWQPYVYPFIPIIFLFCYIIICVIPLATKTKHRFQNSTILPWGVSCYMNYCIPSTWYIIYETRVYYTSAVNRCFDRTLYTRIFLYIMLSFFLLHFHNHPKMCTSYLHFNKIKDTKNILPFQEFMYDMRI